MAQYDFPLHVLTVPQSKLWVIGMSGNKVFIRKMMASNLALKYPGGCGVLNASCRLIAQVAPNGSIRDLMPPFTKFQIWQAANAPKAVKGGDDGCGECPCMSFYDPEVQGAWRERDNGRHHPFCQFNPHALKVYDIAADRAGRRPEGERQERPDEWIRIEQEIATPGAGKGDRRR